LALRRTYEGDIFETTALQEGLDLLALITSWVKNSAINCGGEYCYFAVESRSNDRM